MPNRLAAEHSPYLLQHADNPVDWYPWSPEALQRAKEEDKPIFLSIGYSACHWCHVMAHESFEDPDTAALMNAGFINIKVDREERPDLDHIYMQAVVTISGSGGWPMSVFLTPKGEPFYGGTYFPPHRKFNIPSFTEILQSVIRLWREDRQKLIESSQQVIAEINRNQFIPHSEGELDPVQLDQASLRLAQIYDWTDGGWGNAPKFPQPMVIEFLLRRSITGDRMALEMANHALQSMARGGMYDLIGGGFSRYSTDQRWLVPHFEKMLYDNAQLAMVYLHAFLITKDHSFRLVCEETLDFILRELSNLHQNPQSDFLSFFSSLDADSEGQEGKYYAWSFDEVQQLLSDNPKLAGLQKSVDPFELFQAAFTLSKEGNFEGQNVLQKESDDQALIQRFNLPPGEILENLRIIKGVLFEAREERIRPGLDDKALSTWNSLALTAFAEAARYLKRDDYLQAARKNANFLLNHLTLDGRLMRSWRLGSTRHAAYLEDYANLALALIALYQSDPDVRWYDQAVRLCDEMIASFYDPQGGFFDTHADQEQLITRPKDLQDNATPSGNSQAALALLNVAAYSGSAEWRKRAEEMLVSTQEIAIRYPTAFGNWLCAFDFALNRNREVAILTPPASPDDSSFAEILWDEYRPHIIAAFSSDPANPRNPPLLAGKPPINQLPTAYVCQNFTCQLPTNDPLVFRSQING